MTGEDDSPLTSEHVRNVFWRCMANTGSEGVIIDGVINRTAFNQQEVDACHDEIRSMLAELPTQFMAGKGGGWSFLEACNDRRGRLWTGMQQVMEMLFMLGQAAGMVESLFPPEDWSLLPGRVPYYVIRI